MKNNYILLFLFLPFISFGQWNQLGNDINGLNEEDNFGSRVTLNIDGTVMASGSSRINDNGEFSGQTRVFDWDGSDWIQRGEAINGLAEDWSGSAVSLSDDGNTLAVGAVFAKNEEDILSGLVRIYTWDGTSWLQRGNTIFGIGNPLNFLDSFGRSVSLSGDGNVVVVGAPGRWGENNDSNLQNAGQVSVFEWDGADWSLRGDHIFSTTRNDKFGFSVSVTSDGTTFVAGAWGTQSTSSSTNNNGMVRVFDWDGASWVKRGEDVEGILAGDSFGKAVSISDNGNIIIAGAPGFDLTSTENRDSTAHVFEWDGMSWVQRGNTLVGLNEANEFGDEVSISSNGGIIAIGALANDGARGSVQVFRWDGTNYVQEGETLLGEDFGDNFGAAVAINLEGNVLAVGARFNDNNGSGAGLVSVFENTTLLHSTGVSETAISYFPNPTNGIISIQSSQEVNLLTLYSILGEELFVIKPRGNVFDLDLSSKPLGQYLVKVTSNGTSQIIKIIKK